MMPSHSGEQSQTGKWKEIGREGQTITIETTDDTGQTQKFVLTFEGDDEIVASSPGGPKMFLERVK